MSSEVARIIKALLVLHSTCSRASRVGNVTAPTEAQAVHVALKATHNDDYDYYVAQHLPQSFYHNSTQHHLLDCVIPPFIDSSYRG